MTAAALATPREEISLGGHRPDTVGVVLLLLRAAAVCGDDVGSIAARGENTARRAEEKTGCNKGDAIKLDDVAADADADDKALAPPPLLLHDAAAADAIARRASRDVAKEHRREQRGRKQKGERLPFSFPFFSKGKKNEV